VLGGRYTLREPIGRGSAGQVYRAVQHPLERLVAVKLLRSDLQPHTREVFAQRFLREAALAGRLRHPNIVTVHDFGEQDGTLYVVMELLQGRTLQRALQEGPLSPQESARLVLALAQGLRHAHQAGLVHRDVKPANIMLVPDDDGVEQPMLMDFGLVREADSDPVEVGLTAVGQYMGTPAFMAPEQAKSPWVDHRADIYALGVVLYRMLTGALPFEAPDPLSMALQHQVDPVPPMITKGAVVPAALEAITRRAMEKEPHARYEDAGQMADALAAWLHPGDEPSYRLPPAPPRRGRLVAAALLLGTVLLVATGALLVVAGGAGVAVGWWSHQATPEPIVIFEPPDPALAEPIPAPVPEAPPLEAPPPEPAPEAPAPPKPRAPKPARLEVDGVSFDAAHAARALEFINTATPDTLAQAGVYERGVGLILQKRPFSSMEAFGETSGIGGKTVEAVAEATRAP
jgi:hypothetical protein